MKNSTISVSNVYGIPFINPHVREAATKWEAQLVFSPCNLVGFKRSAKFVLVVAGLPFLQSAGIPILGYHLNARGAFVRDHFPKALTPNSCKLFIPGYRHPDTQALDNFAATEDPKHLQAWGLFLRRLDHDNEMRVYGRSSQGKTRRAHLLNKD